MFSDLSTLYMYPLYYTPSLSFFTANPIGLAIAQLAAPLIVTSVDKVPMMVGAIRCCDVVWIEVHSNVTLCDMFIVAQVFCCTL